ncbi:MAG: hypothetical protein EHM14_07180 [Methanothrix sp.]|nr:MAG: hypothetical protein EHM14_07180 [Methanothrix sp.]
MKYAKFLMALLAACLLIVPAFSMPDSAKEQTNPEGQQLIGDAGQHPNPCDCKDTDAAIGPDGKFGPDSMMDGKEIKQGPQGENDKLGHSDNCAPRSMMDGKEIKQGPQGENDKLGHSDNCAPRSMMDGKEIKQGPQDENDKLGHNDNCGPRSMMDGKETTQRPQCEKPPVNE